MNRANIAVFLLAVLAGVSLAQGSATMGGPNVAAISGLALLGGGSACSSGAQCASGFCTDSVCCDSACSGSCVACSVATGASVDGTCATYADGNVGSPPCSPYLCDGTNATCPASCSTSADCSAGYACSGGVCVGDYLEAFLLTPEATECACPATITGTMGSTLSTTRNSSAYCTRTDGGMTSCAANTLAISAAGLISNHTATNYVPNSQAIDQWTCTNVTTPTANTAAAPDGTTTAELVVGTGAGGYCESASASIDHTYVDGSIYVRSTSGTQAGRFAVWNTTTNALHCGANFTATTTWSRLQGASDNRPYCWATAGSFDDNRALRIYPGGLAGTGTIEVWGASLGRADIASPYIPTGATAVVQYGGGADFTLSQSISTLGCVAARIAQPRGGTLVSNDVWIGKTGASAWSLAHPYTATSIRGYDGTGFVTRNTTSIRSREVGARLAWGGDGGMEISIDGGTTTAAFDGTIGFTTDPAIGGAVGYTALGGQIREIKFGATKEGCQP